MTSKKVASSSSSCSAGSGSQGSIWSSDVLTRSMAKSMAANTACQTFLSARRKPQEYPVFGSDHMVGPTQVVLPNLNLKSVVKFDTVHTNLVYHPFLMWRTNSLVVTLLLLFLMRSPCPNSPCIMLIPLLFLSWRQRQRPLRSNWPSCRQHSASWLKTTKKRTL